MQNAFALILRRSLAAVIHFRFRAGTRPVFFLRLRHGAISRKIRRVRRERVAVLSRAGGVPAAMAAAATAAAMVAVAAVAAARANGGGRDVKGVCQHTVQRMEIDSESGSGEGVHPPVQPGRHGIQDRS